MGDEVHGRFDSSHEKHHFAHASSVILGRLFRVLMDDDGFKWDVERPYHPGIRSAVKRHVIVPSPHNIMCSISRKGTSEPLPPPRRPSYRKAVMAYIRHGSGADDAASEMCFRMRRHGRKGDF